MKYTLKILTCLSLIFFSLCFSEFSQLANIAGKKIGKERKKERKKGREKENKPKIENKQKIGPWMLLKDDGRNGFQFILFSEIKT